MSMDQSLGLHRAVVRSSADPTGTGRVLIAVPAISAEPKWAALCVPFAGRNLVFSPEVGEEVIVAFLDGDLRFPICLGLLWNGHTPPTTARP
jgi:uncharacterized protein involved in type VI secretion and phage assembly